jgi:DNA invertase Pin-like site-specific DNA recombinase
LVALAAEAVERIRAEEGQVLSSTPPRRWRLVDRLGEQVIREILAQRRSGLTKQALADRYDISLSSVKRILKRGVDPD